ncbi:MAG: orotidine-5'-phosphate decarboxylase [Stellaceae bacterium]|jgi:orotidine-5'-phosphate decarboxylase
MPGSTARTTRADAARERLIVALDFPDLAAARALVDELGDEMSFYKVGPHLFAKGLIDFIEYLVGSGKRVFLDFKSVDIGETMRGMIARVSALGVDFATIMGTPTTIAAASAGRGASPKPKILFVTLLTDHSEAEMRREYNTAKTVEEFVAERARIAVMAGADGVISSPREAAAIRRAVPQPGFLIVTPGVRPAGSAAGDQARIATPAAAIAAGADYLVIGRPIIRAEDRLAAARQILDEMQEALASR